MNSYLRPNVKLTTVMKCGKKVPTLVYEKQEKETQQEQDLPEIKADPGLAVVPFARSSQTVRRGSAAIDFDEKADKENVSRNSPLSKARKKLSFPWKNIGTANRSTLERIQNIEASTSLPAGIGAVKGQVVVRRSAQGGKRSSASRSLHKDFEELSRVIQDDELPHPSKLRKKKKGSSQSSSSSRRQQHQGEYVFAHVRQLRRKQAEFNWVPSSDHGLSLSDTVDLIEAAEKGLQRVPGSPVFKRTQWMGLPGRGFYNESPVPAMAPASTHHKDENEFKLSHELILDNNELATFAVTHDTSHDNFELNLQDDLGNDDPALPSEVSWLAELETSCGLAVADQTKEE